MRLTQIEAASQLRCSVRTIYRLRRAGCLPYFPGRPITIDSVDLDQYQATSKCRDTPDGPISKSIGRSSVRSTGRKMDHLEAARWANRMLKSLEKPKPISS